MIVLSKIFLRKMGKDNRPWRKLVKKLQRSKRRKAKANALVRNIEISIPTNEESIKVNADYSNSSTELSETESEILERLQHDADEAAFWERENEAQAQFEKRKAAIARRRKIELDKRLAMRLEWEQIKEKDRIMEEERKIREEISQAEKEERFNELLEFLAGDIENPPHKFLMPELLDIDQDPCLYYSRTGACRYFNRCKRPHPQPTLSSTILIQNFFSHFYLQQGLSQNEYQTDLTLEYEESDLYKEFIKFYKDVLPEFRSVGNVVQFKVCSNFEPHLRGNVYVQYDSIKESVQAYRVFNARFYGGKQLTVQFVKISSWRNAICGQFSRRRCEKGKSCSYLHPFRNPTSEFVPADNDWPEPSQHHRHESRRKERDKTYSKSDRHAHSSSHSKELSSSRLKCPEKAGKGDSSSSSGTENSTTSDPDKSTPETSPIRTNTNLKMKKRQESQATKSKGTSMERDREQEKSIPEKIRKEESQYRSKKDFKKERRRSRSREKGRKDRYRDKSKERERSAHKDRKWEHRGKYRKHELEREECEESRRKQERESRRKREEDREHRRKREKDKRHEKSDMIRKQGREKR